LEKPARNLAVDTYRGFVMFLMMAEVAQLSRVAKALPGNGFWNFLAYHQTHVEWAGCSLHDTIQRLLVSSGGGAATFRRGAHRQGGTFGSMFLHALWRSLLLIALGVFLRSTHAPQTYYTFEDTLSQIGLGYPLLFLLAYRPPRWQWAALGVLLFGYWLAWALYPAQPVGFFSGFAAHWNKGNKIGNAFDVWFLNLFPTVKPYVANSGGYLTLSFHTDVGHDDPRLRGTMAARRSAYHSDAAIAGGGRHWYCPLGLLLHFTGISSDSEAHLDSRVDAVQRRPMLPSSWRASAG
jgi:predicted acyltransferase